MVVYRTFYGERGLWVRPASMWNEIVEYNGEKVKRFTPIESTKMKVILSRKGSIRLSVDAKSDSADKTLLSMPIPIEKENNSLLFAEIEYDNRTYSEYLNQLNPKKDYKFVISTPIFAQMSGKHPSATGFRHSVSVMLQSRILKIAV